MLRACSESSKASMLSCILALLLLQVGRVRRCSAAADVADCRRNPAGLAGGCGFRLACLSMVPMSPAFLDPELLQDLSQPQQHLVRV